MIKSCSRTSLGPAVSMKPEATTLRLTSRCVPVGLDHDITSSSHGPDASDGQEEVLDYSCQKTTHCSSSPKTVPISTLKVPYPSFLDKSVLLDLSSGPVGTCHCSHRQLLPGSFYTARNFWTLGRVEPLERQSLSLPAERTSPNEAGGTSTLPGSQAPILTFLVF